MIELEQLKENILIDNNNLQEKKDNYLSTFISLNLNSNLLSQVNESLIEYFKNNLNNLNLSSEEILSINKSFNYFAIINSLGIDLNNLYLEDKNLILFRENIKLLYLKLLEYKDLVIFNIESKINSNNSILEIIKQIESITNSDNIDLDKIHELIILLPIKEKVKKLIYKEIYNRYIKKLKKTEESIEQEASDVLERIILETDRAPEIEEKIEKKGIKLEITEEDRKLQELIRILLYQVEKLNSKFPTEMEMKNISQEEQQLITEDKIKNSKVCNDIKSLWEEFENYLQNKDSYWEVSDYNKEEVEEYLKELYDELLSKYNSYNSIYQELYAKYGNTYRNINNDVGEFGNAADNIRTPIIFFVDGIDRFMEESSANIPASLLDALEKSKNFITKIKDSLVYLKQREFTKLNVDLINGLKNGFREIKVVNRTKNDLAIRIYYEFFTDSNENSYPVVFMIYAKPDSKPMKTYKHISGVIGSKYFKDFMQSLPEQSKLEKVLDLEKKVYEKIEELENQKLQNQLITGGSSK